MHFLNFIFCFIYLFISWVTFTYKNGKIPGFCLSTVIQKHTAFTSNVIHYTFPMHKVFYGKNNRTCLTSSGTFIH